MTAGGGFSQWRSLSPPPEAVPRLVTNHRTQRRQRSVLWLSVVALAGFLAIVDWRVTAGPSSAAPRAASSEAPFSAGGPAATAEVSTGTGGQRAVSVRGGARQGRPASGGTSMGPATAPSGGGSGGVTNGVSAGVPNGAAAMRAVAAYFQAFTGQDPQGVFADSDYGALAMAGVVLDSAAINTQRGAATTMTTGPSSLAPVSESGNEVVLDGALSITTSISGAQGTGTSTNTFSGPLTVTDESGTWRVTGFSYDGQPVDFWNAGTSQTVDGLTVSLGYVVSYGDLTAALVTLRQSSGSADVSLQRVTLEGSGSSEVGTGDFTGPPVPSGVLRFSRADFAPMSLVVNFSSPSGQGYDFAFQLH